MTLADKRRAIRHLLDERDPADAMAAYYAFHHPARKTELFVYPPEAGRARGYVALSRTGMDLFRPLATMRLPADDFEAGAALIDGALTEGMGIIVAAPEAYRPLLEALFFVDQVQQLTLLALDRSRFRPVINVLVARTESPNELPRFIIRHQTRPGQTEVVASASLNWQSPSFAEIAVRTSANYRRRGWGRSVVSAMAQHLLESGRTPLYVVDQANEPSLRLARSIGFRDTGVGQILLEGRARHQN